MNPAVDPLFEVHPLNEIGFERAGTIADRFTQLLNEIRPLVPEGREWNIVKNKLEEASFYAKKGMSSLSTNQGKSTSARSAG